MKFSKLSQAVNVNEETAKKFVRKNPVLGTSRRLEPQCSERYFEPISNSNNWPENQINDWLLLFFIFFVNSSNFYKLKFIKKPQNI